MSRLYTLQATEQACILNEAVNFNGATVLWDGITDANRASYNQFPLNSLITVQPGIGGVAHLYGGTIDGLHSSGWTNAVMCALLVNDSRALSTLIEQMTIQNQVGFPISGIVASNVEARYCNFLNNGNGVNVNADYFHSHHHYFSYSEGHECGGSYAHLHDNVYDHVYTAISLGGDTQSHAGHPGCVVEDETINSVESGFTAIAAVDGLKDAIIRRVTVGGGALYGMVITISGGASSSDGLLVTQVTIQNCQTGIYIPNTPAWTNIVLDGCTIINNSFYGLQIANPNVTIKNCTVTGNGTKDVILMPSSAGCDFQANNTYGTLLDQR